MASENLNQSSVALTPVEATDYAESVAAYKAQKRPFLSFLSGISAGACIALAFVFHGRRYVFPLPAHARPLLVELWFPD